MSTLKKTNVCATSIANIDLCKIAFLSKNLVYISLNEKHIDSIWRSFDDNISKYMVHKPPQSIEEVRELVEMSVAGMRDKKYLAVAVHDRNDGEFLGCVAINGLCTPTPELGIWIKKKSQGRGIATESLGTVLAWVQKRFCPRYYRYPVDERNLASCALARHFGGKVEREPYEIINCSGKILKVLDFYIPLVRVVS